MVTIVDPHIKRDPHYQVHKEATEQHLYIKDEDGGSALEGWCWPGSSSYLDFTAHKVRQWWAGRFDYSKYLGSSSTLYTWNDMNEPSVFNGPEVSMKKGALSLDNVEHREWHNLYGFYQHWATAMGQLVRQPEEDQFKKRPFVLSRAFAAGTQRHGAIWTGDNKAEWSHLRVASPMLLSLGIAGLPFVGADVGGFFGDPDSELLIRWYQAAAFQPFYRAHAHIDTKRREPWLFGEEVLGTLRDAVLMRYKYLPYLYTLFAESARNGMPVMRPMWARYTQDEAVGKMDGQWMLGDALLVHPVYKQGVRSVEMYFPEDVWYMAETGELVHQGAEEARLNINAELETLPLFQRGGSVVAQKRRVRRATPMMLHDPFTLQVALDKEGQAQGEVYLDDESTMSSKSMLRVVEVQGTSLTSSASPHSLETYTPSNIVERVVIYGWPKNKPATKAVVRQGTKEVEVQVLKGKHGDIVVRNPGVLMGEDFRIDIV